MAGEARARTRGVVAAGLTVLLGGACAGVDPSSTSSEAHAEASAERPGPSAPVERTVPGAADSTPAADGAPTRVQAAWDRVDALFEQVLRWSTRAPVLAGLDETAIDRSGQDEWTLSFKAGVTGFAPDPSCDPERSKCGDWPTWADDGGIYLHLRAHHDLYAAGIFDASHAIEPLTLDVQVFASDPGLRAALLRDLGILVGRAPSVPAGCPAVAEQIATRRDDLRRGRQPDAAEALAATLEGFGPAHDLLDLDGDGRFELVLEERDGGNNTDHYFFATRDGCPRLVAVINLWPVGGIGCRRARERPLCDLHTSQMMIHGDQQSSVWTFDGTRYVEAPR